MFGLEWKLFDRFLVVLGGFLRSFCEDVGLVVHSSGLQILGDFSGSAFGKSLKVFERFGKCLKVLEGFCEFLDVFGSF